MSLVYCLGLAVIDRVFACDQIPDAATKYRASRTETVLGGSATNAAIAIARLGGTPALAARIGDDANGSEIAQRLGAEGLATTWLNVSENAQSSHSAVITDPSGERQIINFRGENLDDRTQWIAPPEKTTAVLADTRWPDGMAAALKAARKANVPGIVDVDTPLDHCDLTDATHLAFARRALAELSGTMDITEGLRKISATFDAWLCVTDGENGTYLLENDQIIHVPALAVAPIDTLGAGDVWHGAFALALAEGKDEITATYFANVAAGLKCTQKGVAKGMPTRATVDETLREILK